MIDQDDIIDFLRQNGGRVTNIELYVAFKGKIKNAEDKKQFPVLVNNVAFVKKKTENGEEIKYTYLRKQFKIDERKEIDSLPKQIHDHQPVSAPSSKSNRIREEPLEPNQNTERKPDRDEREHREDTRTKITEQQKVQNQPNQRSVSPILRDHKAEKLDKHRKLIQESMSSHSSRESLNSRESKENTPRHSRESTPQHQIKGSDPEFKKPQPIGIKNNRKREEMGVLGHNNNSNIKSNNDLGGSCGSLSSNHSTGAESTGSRERSHIDATEKLWIHSIIKDDQKKVKELLEERLDLLEYRDYILGYTGAHWAVKTNNLHILKMLIHGGIDLNATSHNGGTLLHLAIQSGHFKMVKELTSHRKMSKLVCDIKARDNAGRLPRHYIDDDKFEPDEIDYMKRIIEPPRLDTISLDTMEDSSFNERRESITKDGSGFGQIFRSVRKGTMFGSQKSSSKSKTEKKVKNQSMKSSNHPGYAPNNPSPQRGWNNI